MRAFRFTDQEGVDIYVAVPWPGGTGCIPPHTILFRNTGPGQTGVRPFSFNGEVNEVPDAD